MVLSLVYVYLVCVPCVSVMCLSCLCLVCVVCAYLVSCLCVSCVCLSWRPTLFFSAVQMNNGSESVRTMRRMCHGLPLRVGFI